MAKRKVDPNLDMGQQAQREQRCRRDDGRVFFHKEKPSRRLAKAIVEKKEIKVPGVTPFLHWENDLYYGSIRHYPDGGAFGDSAYSVIGITSKDESARHDWRDFQQIKNDLVGEDWEGVELYPAESRLIDPSNRFYLFCFPPGVLRQLGLPKPGRDVQGPVENGPPQRPFPEGL